MISVLGQFRNGLRVRGTIRSLKDESKVTTMRALLPRIELVEADRTGRPRQPDRSEKFYSITIANGAPLGTPRSELARSSAKIK